MKKYFDRYFLMDMHKGMWVTYPITAFLILAYITWHNVPHQTLAIFGIALLVGVVFQTITWIIGLVWNAWQHQRYAQYEIPKSEPEEDIDTIVDRIERKASGNSDV
jgi:hypothetical protein